uniref:hypothetical protein n=1 Tax=Actinokineospora sp. CA-119265 TaxID=3239890 RepID=UPI003F493D3F
MPTTTIHRVGMKCREAITELINAHDAHNIRRKRMTYRVDELPNQWTQDDPDGATYTARARRLHTIDTAATTAAALSLAVTAALTTPTGSTPWQDAVGDLLAPLLRLWPFPDLAHPLMWGFAVWLVPFAVVISLVRSIRAAATHGRHARPQRALLAAAALYATQLVLTSDAVWWAPTSPTLYVLAATVLVGWRAFARASWRHAEQVALLNNYVAAQDPPAWTPAPVPA